MKIIWLSCLIGLNSAKSNDEIKEDFKKLEANINEKIDKSDSSQPYLEISQQLAQLQFDIYEKSNVDFEHNREICLSFLSNIRNLKKSTFENENRFKTVSEAVKVLNDNLKAMEDRYKHTETELRADVREAKKGNKLAVTMICVACGSIIIFFGTCFYKLFYS